MSGKGMTVFTHEGEDYTINDSNIAREFDSTVNYTKGDYVTWEGRTHRFLVDHPAGAWVLADVEHVSMGSEIKNLYGEIDKAVSLTNGIKINDPYITHENQYYSNSGHFNNMDGYRVIVCCFTAGKNNYFLVSGYDWPSNYHGYVFLDEDDEQIEAGFAFNGPFTNWGVKAPDNAVKMIVNGQGNYLPEAHKIEFPFLEIPFKEQEMNKYFNNSLSESTMQGYSFLRTVFEPNKKAMFHVSGYDWSAMYSGYYFLRKDGTLVSKCFQINGHMDMTITAPEDACILVVNGHVSGGDYSNAPNTTFLGYSAEDENSSIWTGKKIVWFGTSIPEGAVNGKSYPMIVAEKLGATVYNESLGASPMSSGVPVNASRLRALSLTYEEKQEQSWWSSLSDAEKTVAMNSAFDYKVTKYLTGGTVGPVDLYVFDHGYNDYYYPDPSNYMTEPDDPNDKSYPLGAANFLINAILNDNPRARIVWIGHYEGALDDPTDHQSWGKPVAELQEYISEKYGIPLCRTWEKTGWSNPHKITTTGYWNGTTWVASGRESRQDYVKNCMFSDGIHPHTDGSGYSTQLLAEIIAAFLNDL